MSNTTVIHTNPKPSKLAQFNLGFEFNETWADARKKYSTGKN